MNKYKDIMNRNKYVIKSRTKHKLSKSIPANKRDQLESFGEADLKKVTPTVPPRYKVVSISKDISDLPHTNSLITVRPATDAARKL